MKIAVLSAAAGAVFLSGVILGWSLRDGEARREAVHAAQDRLAQEIVVRRAVTAATHATAAVEQGFAVRSDDEQARTRSLLKEIPRHVPVASDPACSVPVGLVRLHDAAAGGLDLSAVPDTAGRADDAASSVADPDLAAVVVDNYGACRRTAAQLTALQGWITQQARLWPSR